jgi:hypothetical protein
MIVVWKRAHLLYEWRMKGGNESLEPRGVPERPIEQLEQARIKMIETGMLLYA